MDREKKIIIAWRILILICVIFFVGYIFQKNIPLDGRRELEYTFGQAKGEIAHLRPFSRVLREHEHGVLSEQILESPVYLDVYSFVPYTKAHITVWFSNVSSQSFSLGVQRTVHADKLLMKEFELISHDNDWTRGEVSYNLSGIPLMRGGYIFVFSIPGLDQSGTDKARLRVSRIHITLERKSLISEIRNRFLFKNI